MTRKGKDVRVCQRCGYRLSDYNPSDFCHSCQENKRGEDCSLRTTRADAVSRLDQEEALAAFFDYSTRRVRRTRRFGTLELLTPRYQDNKIKIMAGTIAPGPVHRLRIPKNTGALIYNPTGSVSLVDWYKKQPEHLVVDVVGSLPGFLSVTCIGSHEAD